MKKYIKTVFLQGRVYVALSLISKSLNKSIALGVKFSRTFELILEILNGSIYSQTGMLIL